MTKIRMPSRQKPKELPDCTRFVRHEWEYVGERSGVLQGKPYHKGLYKCACGVAKEGLPMWNHRSYK